MKRLLGMEIGQYRIKLAYLEQGRLKKFLSARKEEAGSPEKRQDAKQIRELLDAHHIRCKQVVFVLPQEQTYVKRLSLPLLTTEQLKRTLPYEFVDYIGEQMDEYQFDYAVLERNDKQLDLLAAACKRELCDQLERFAKQAGLKLVGLVPAVIGLERLLNPNQDNKQDFVVIDLGFRAIRIYFFRQGFYDTTRILEPGCEELEQIVQTEGEASEAFSQCCQTIAIQIMRVVTFYSFNHIDNTLDTLYYCGGGARYQTLLSALDQAVEIPAKSLNEWVPDLDLTEAETADWLDSPQTLGVLLT